MKVLLIEGDITQGSTLRSALEALGHEVVWILGSKSPDLTAGDAISSSQQAPTSVNLSNVQVALIGGHLAEHSCDGALIGLELTRRGGIGCIGIGDEASNQTLEARGAVHISCSKENVFPLIELVARVSRK